MGGVVLEVVAEPRGDAGDERVEVVGPLVGLVELLEDITDFRGPDLPESILERGLDPKQLSLIHI